MKKILFCVLIFNSASAQPPGEWMWIHGSSSLSPTASWGTQGVPSPTNVPPALFEPASMWTDLNGNFWFYGGSSLAALWKYDPVANMWTWVKGPSTGNYPGSFGVQGVPSPANNPPHKRAGAAAWVDLQGDFWMYGGWTGSANYSDLWKYNIATNMWTWMKGDSTLNHLPVYGLQGVPNITNHPGSRSAVYAAWVDAIGDLWMFGGARYVMGSGSIGDMWRYNIATNTWTWMKGPTTVNNSGVYGTLGVENPANYPCVRHSYCHWKDRCGYFWIFAGYRTVGGSLNDLWRFNPFTNNWTWMGGSPLAGATDVYGTQCIADTANVPGARYTNTACWTDSNGNLWTFGGANNGMLQNVWNDLWMYCIATNKWTWVAGDSINNPIGNWGTIGVPSSTNKPNGRCGSAGWTDGNNHLYLFAGSTTGYLNPYNDMWKYTIDTNCSFCPHIVLPQINILGSSIICSGSCTAVGAAACGGTEPYTYTWSPNIGTGPGPYQVCPTSTTVYTVTITDASSVSSSATFQVVVNPSPSATASQITNVNCFGGNDGSATVSASGGTPPYSYHWNPTNQTTASVSNLSAGNYSVIITDSLGCSDTVGITITSPSALTVSHTIVNPSCATCCDGNITLTPGGGTPPYNQLCNPSVPPYCVGVYNCCITDANDCIVCDSITLSFTTNIGLTDWSEPLIYPNPSTDELIISFPTPLKNDIEIKINNLLGKELQTIIIRQSVTATRIRTEELHEGIYFVFLKDRNGNKAVRKFVKQ